MMMKMLEAGGLPPVTDEIRGADEDNPRGYYELEAVKKTARDPSWVETARGKVVKVISQLLRDLPDEESYRVIFMRRNLDEVLRSQQKMLERRDEVDGANSDDMKSTFSSHVEDVEAWMRSAAHVQTLFVSYNRMQSEPDKQLARIAAFLDCEKTLDLEAMAAVVDPALYRQRA